MTPSGPWLRIACVHRRVDSDHWSEAPTATQLPGRGQAKLNKRRRGRQAGGADWLRAATGLNRPKGRSSPGGAVLCTDADRTRAADAVPVYLTPTAWAGRGAANSGSAPASFAESPRPTRFLPLTALRTCLACW